MDKAIEQAVGRVIEAMRDNLGEQLTVDDMARMALFSKFHFSRIFQRITGVPPGQFLSAMRLQEAKRLLISTSLTVTEISHRVGYTSVGTFSWRFRNSVGVAPTTYRELGGLTLQSPVNTRRNTSRQRAATIRGQVCSPLTDQIGMIFIGLFADRIPQGQPVRYTMLHRTGHYLVEDVPKGTWYLIAHSVAASLEEVVQRGQDDSQALCVGVGGPIKIQSDTVSVLADVELEPILAPASPVLRAILDVRSVALTVSAA